MLKRKAEKEFLDWKKTESDKALLVMGARQVGKTYLIDDFAKSNYENVVKFDLVDQSDVLKAMDAASSSEEIFMAISAFAGNALVPNETVIFIDEVQECKQALVLIKYLLKRHEFDYILSGSLLGVELNDLRSAPVGYVHVVEMYPLDFEEFCWANNVGEDAWSEARKAFREKRAVQDAVHERLLKLFHWYLIVGGMPDPVRGFVENGDIAQLHSRQEDILTLYRYDIAKYATKSSKLMIREIFDQIPSQLDSKTKRFNFSALAPKGTYERYSSDFLWLVDAGVAIPVRNVSEPKKPLKLVENRSFFKLFMNDVGLLSCACGIKTARSVIANDGDINYGSIYENAVAQELNTRSKGVYFFRSRKQGELDFVFEMDGRVVPIEVKSGKDYKRHNALTNVLSDKNYDIRSAIVLCESNLHVDGKIAYCPIYMAAFL